MTRTVTGLFDSYDAATQAVRDLEAAGIPHRDISIVANNAGNRWSSPSGRTAENAGSGAASGASVGAALGGGAEVMTSGQQVKIPSETRLTFRLQTPVQI